MFLDLIFLMQVQVGNEKSFGKQAKTFLIPQWFPVLEK